MTDKNRIQRENAVAEALLGPGKTARNLMRLLINAHEGGNGLILETWACGSEIAVTYRIEARDVFAVASPSPAPLAPDAGGQVSRSVARRVAAQKGQAVPEFGE